MELAIEKKATTDIQKIFQAQRANQYAVAAASISERKSKLKKLKKAIEYTFRQEIRDALKAD